VAVNSQTLTKLRRTLDQGRLVPVVGAGVSIASAAMPSWKTLLGKSLAWAEEHAEELRLTRKILKDLHKTVNQTSPTTDCYGRFAAVIANAPDGRHWTAPSFAQWLEHFFGKPQLTDPTLLESIAGLQARFLVTTNYDPLVASVVKPGKQTASWRELGAMVDIIRTGDGVIHLHGGHQDPESVILTSADYERVALSSLQNGVGDLLNSSGVLLFIGMSVEGVLDRHLGRILGNANVLPMDQALKSDPHIFLHRGALPPGAVSRLHARGIEAVCVGDDHLDLPNFLDRLAVREATRQRGSKMLDLDGYVGEPLSESDWAPNACINRVQKSIEFFGNRSAKWAASSDGLEGMLRRLDAVYGSAKFLVVDPTSDAYGRLQARRDKVLEAGHYHELLRLSRLYRSFEVRCIDFLPTFRLVRVDGREIGVALYETGIGRDKSGWTTPHITLKTDRIGSFGNSFVHLFDEQFQKSRNLEELIG
jgi:SIR2-like domain